MSGPDGLLSRTDARPLALALLVACGRTHASAAPAPPAPPAPVTKAESTTTTPAPVAPEVIPWAALVRDERWDSAWRALEALPDADRSRPEVRYVRARVALARGDSAAAPPLLDALEGMLPLLADDIGRRRAEARLAVGPFADAGEWFAARVGPAAQLDSARAFEKARDVRRSRAAVERVLSNDKRTRAQESEARALRIRLGDPPGDADRADARWLVLQGADLPAAADSLTLVARMDPKHPLTAPELMTRARVLSDAGRTDDALHAIDLAGGAPGAEAVSNLERGRARGMALYHARGRFSEAAKVLAECAGVGGPTAAEDAFHAARALSRADRDEEAIRGYEDVERRFPKSTWARQAAFLVPYLRMLHGDWRGCARGFDAYLRPVAREGSDDDARDARRDGALCKLEDGDAKAARTAFERLVEDEGDPLLSARMADMAALAALRDKDRSHAIARWTDVARSRPLSWPALVARARLTKEGGTLPLPIDAPDVTPQSAAPLSVGLPPPADLLHRLGLDSDAELALRDRESAVTSGVGGRALEALCSAYGELGRARRRFQVSQAVPSVLLAAAPSPQTRWAWDCAFPSPYADTVQEVEAGERLPHGLLWAVARQESGFDPDAVSPARAVGLMQLLPDTARPIAEELGLPPDDARLQSPPFALRVGGRLLRKLLDEFHGDVPLAVAAYNAGAEAIARWASRASGMELDTFVERIPFKETRDYVARVMGNFARYGYLAGGDAGVPTVELALPPR
jgi:soluble lytic murein transglycosylase